MIKMNGRNIEGEICERKKENYFEKERERVSKNKE
jgi:hypothetical protein